MHKEHFSIVGKHHEYIQLYGHVPIYQNNHKIHNHYEFIYDKKEIDNINLYCKNMLRIYKYPFPLLCHLIYS